ncbi:MAG: hypothetical protein AABY28_06525 [Candidatus Omnitrophota bacterium]
MKIITVSGAHSNVGKTTFIEGLLKKLKGWSCLKVTVLHKGNCPVGRICSGCEELSSKFFIVHDKRALQEKGKDTQRFKAAGAKDVLWLRAKPHGLKQGIIKSISRFKNSKGLIIEGTSVLKYLDPDIAILIKKRDSLLKGSAKDVFKKVDLILTL